MTASYTERVDSRPLSWVEEKLFMGQTFSQYARSLVTPFNAVAAVIVLVGLAVAVMRFTQ